MKTHDLIASWSDIWKHARDRRGALKLLGGTLLGATLTQVDGDDAEAACRKRGRCSKKKRCCKGFVCKRGKCQKRRKKPGGGNETCPPNQQRCNGTCVNVNTDPRNCGSCGND